MNQLASMPPAPVAPVAPVAPTAPTAPAVPVAAVASLTRHARRVCAAWVGLLLLSAPAFAADGAQLFSDAGCINCHSRQSRSAPTLDELVKELKRKGDQPEALQAVLQKLHRQSHIRSHQTVSDASALVILKWLAQGGQ